MQCCEQERLRIFIEPQFHVVVILFVSSSIVCLKMYIWSNSLTNQMDLLNSVGIVCVIFV